MALVGAGGKTSLMFAMASELEKKGRVLVTTSTKIEVPPIGFVSALPEEDGQSLSKPSVTVLGKFRPQDGKLEAVDFCERQKAAALYDFVLIEADGSRRLPFKFWKPHEPVLDSFVTKAVGVIPVTMWGTRIEAQNCYYPEGAADFGYPERVSADLIANLILSSNGMFKNFFGDRYIFINKTDTLRERERARELIRRLKALTGPQVQYVYGSVREGRYERP